jgi:tetratricopeptide (TPR) repeat protein
MGDLDLGDRIESLLSEGLDHYGGGRIDRAVMCWREVLRLDPNCGEARDYLADAGAEGDPQSDKPNQGRPYKDSLLDEAKQAIAAGDLEPAFELLELLAEQEPTDLPIQGHYELVRFELSRVYREQLGAGDRVYEIVDRDRLFKFNLPTEAGYLASLIDGAASLDSILDMSAIDRFETVRTLVRLRGAGVIRDQS